MKPSRHHSFFISVALRPLFYLIFAPEHPAGAYKADTKTHVRTLAHPGHRHTFNTRSSGSILKTPQSHCMSHRPIGFVLLFAVPDQWTSAWIEPMRLLISGCDQSSPPPPCPRLQSTCARMWPRPRVVKTLGVPRLWLVVRRLARRLEMISPRDDLMVVRVFFPLASGPFNPVYSRFEDSSARGILWHFYQFLVCTHASAPSSPSSPPGSREQTVWKMYTLQSPNPVIS